MIFSKGTRRVVTVALKYACQALPQMSSSPLNYNARLPLVRGLQGIYSDTEHLGSMKKAETGTMGIPTAAMQSVNEASIGSQYLHGLATRCFTQSPYPAFRMRY